MPVYKADVIHRLLEAEQEKILDCLAGWVLTHFNSREARNAWLERMYEKRLGPKECNKDQAELFITDLRNRIWRIWESNKVSKT